jgi:hypothetical protein
MRRIRRWWRQTPPKETARAFIGLGLVLMIVAAVLAYTL